MMRDDNNLDAMVADMRRQLDELKARQVVGGASTRIRSNQTAAVVDQGATGSSLTFTVSFMADKQDYAMAELMPLLYVNSPGNVASLQTDYEATVWRTKQASDPRLTTWRVQLLDLTGSARAWYLKSVVMSTDTGVLS